ncbi:agmatine deiminase [Marinococcus halophilus]|uniref:Putative agmatine deiminase n=1 Tax=Marinococcus halophilus TaxID=1371 RepID=A0A510Y967_MARHA|nr:agmatine deiminase [Marinococcus halophilus]OZT79084.1 agmatine deiminase [Marinococcus halophilus]GEK59932.1 putative agmatine deiminase 2 [Marinococcus halophilus]
MTTLHSQPVSDGFRMPGEFEPHTGTWMLWPHRTDTWRAGAKPGQKVFKEIASAISRFEPVTVCVRAEQYQHARAILPDEVRVLEMSFNDAWMRDIGPLFLIDDKGGLRGADFQFNAWGGINKSLYFPWDQDVLVSQKVLETERVDRYNCTDLVLEGGGIYPDGEGTLITTKECLLNTNRNPNWSQEEIEQRLKETLNVQKIIWLERGLVGDETDGHIDEVLCYIRPGEVALSWTDDPEHPQYAVLNECYEKLAGERDASGRAFTIHKIPLPEQPVLTEQESEEIDHTIDSYARLPNDPCIASYVNCYLCNEAVILPQFNDPLDKEAVKIFSTLFPEREIVPIYTRELSLAGGNIHCITQQQPAR